MKQFCFSQGALNTQFAGCQNGALYIIVVVLRISLNCNRWAVIEAPLNSAVSVV